jgi:hypothetical protein
VPAVASPLVLHGSMFGIGSARFLRLGDCLRGYQDSLSFVTLSAAAEPNDDGSQRTILTRPPAQCRIASRQKLEMIQVGTCQAERLFRLQT